LEVNSRDTIRSDRNEGGTLWREGKPHESFPKGGAGRRKKGYQATQVRMFKCGTK